MFLKAFSSKIEKYAQQTPDSDHTMANYMVNMFDKKSKEDKREIMENSESFIKFLDRM